jgi:hypothetical protein
MEGTSQIDLNIQKKPVFKRLITVVFPITGKFHH